jgi:hypothetical protein
MGAFAHRNLGLQQLQGSNYWFNFRITIGVIQLSGKGIKGANGPIKAVGEKAKLEKLLLRRRN